MSKQLAVNPTETAVIVNLNITKVGPNPYRDMIMFPIQEAKVASLVESIEKTGFWPSIIARPLDNKVDGVVVTKEELDKMVADGYDFSGTTWEKCFAHHRQAALEAMGWNTIPIIPQVVSDETMLLRMANENKEGFGSNINSQLETVRQVKISLEDSIEGLDDFEAYKGVGGTFFETSKSFKNAQSQGIGFKVVKKFLGETWSERDVRGPVVVLKAIDDGLILQEEIVNVPNIGLLDGIAAIARVLYEGYAPQKKDAEATPAPNWPVYVKDAALQAVIVRCSKTDKNPEATVTVKNLINARQALIKVGANPANVLASGKAGTAYDIVAAMKKELILKDVALDENLAAIDIWAERDDVADWEGTDDLVVKLKESATKISKGEDDTVDPGTSESGLDATEEGDVNKAIADAEGAIEGGALVNDMFGDAGDGGEATPIYQVVNQVAQSCEVINVGISQLVRRADEFENDETFDAAIATLLTNVATLAFLKSGKPVLTDAFKAATTFEAPAEVTEEVTDDEA